VCVLRCRCLCLCSSRGSASLFCVFCVCRVVLCLLWHNFCVFCDTISVSFVCETSSVSFVCVVWRHKWCVCVVWRHKCCVLCVCRVVRVFCGCVFCVRVYPNILSVSLTYDISVRACVCVWVTCVTYYHMITLTCRRTSVSRRHRQFSFPQNVLPRLCTSQGVTMEAEVETFQK